MRGGCSYRSAVRTSSPALRCNVRVRAMGGTPATPAAIWTTATSSKNLTKQTSVSVSVENLVCVWLCFFSLICVFYPWWFCWIRAEKNFLSPLLIEIWRFDKCSSVSSFSRLVFGDDICWIAFLNALQSSGSEPGFDRTQGVRWVSLRGWAGANEQFVLCSNKMCINVLKKSCITFSFTKGSVNGNLRGTLHPTTTTAIWNKYLCFPTSIRFKNLSRPGKMQIKNASRPFVYNCIMWKKMKHPRYYLV